ncbi:tetratricopeptide repeat protein [Nakamurella sp. PAMC28650]|uniref:tetratricopeptide repeat protein n=1 Tax=Nakamurella sp. PAMC28650 TaxID=2762325 RepID=UPI00164E5B89|nr:tetratricopeptide repeat protein [Nakamurella sp. PAMC28650]QNK82758.1 tetratricopeptide repeat protein [Nakamurella sp. PAMC28650]
MNDPAGALERAALLKDSGRSGPALALLAPYLAQNPDDLSALRLAGWCHFDLDELDPALYCAARLAALAPEQPAAHLLLAVVQGRRQNVTASVEAIDTAIRLAPHNSEPYRIAAALDLQGHRTSPRTERLARRAVTLAPHDAIAHRVLGSTLIELRRYDEAAVELGQAAALNPGDAAVTSELARIDIAKGRSASAAVGFAAAVRADPTDDIARHNLQAATWNAFRIAHLVLWLSFLVLGRFTVLSDSGATSRLAHVVGPIAVLATLGAWAFQLRSRPSGFPVLLTATRSDRMLSIAMASHALCLVFLLAAAFAPTAVAGPLLIVVTVLLLVGTVVGWIRVSQLRKQFNKG